MRILCVTSGQYPYRSAASQRLHLLSCMLSETGHEVRVICRNKVRASGTEGAVSFVSTFSSPRTFLGKVYDIYYEYSFRVKQEIIKYKPSAVLLTECRTSLARWLVRNSKKYGYQLFHDSVEWFSKEEYRHPLLSSQYLKKQFWMKHLFPNTTGIIAISQYLEDYFLKRGNRCLRVPSVCDSVNINYNYDKCGDKLIIVYAGSPGKKDRFKDVIDALLMLEPSERSRMIIRIIGASRSQIADNAEISLEKLALLSDCMEFCGVMAREDVYKNLCVSDFTILLRPDKARYAKAGFPTKVPEGMAAGTPPICNLTSDLGQYLNNSNSVIVEDCSVPAVLVALKQVLSLNQDQLKQMKMNARKTAERFFDYRVYKEKLDLFVRGFLQK